MYDCKNEFLLEDHALTEQFQSIQMSLLHSRILMKLDRLVESFEGVASRWIWNGFFRLSPWQDPAIKLCC